MTYMFWKVARTKFLGSISLSLVAPTRSNLSDTLKIGIPASLNMGLVAVGAIIIQWAIGNYGEEALAGYGIALRIEQILLLPTI